jgi:hypothetical protein
LLRAELNRLGIRDINSVQALLLANIGREEIAKGLSPRLRRPEM